MVIEEEIAKWIKAYLPYFLPGFNLGLRLLLNLFSRDTPGTFRRLFSLPEDLIFVALGILFSGMAGAIPAFTAHYRAHNMSATLAGGVLAFLGIAAAFIVHYLDSKIVTPIFQEVYIAHREINNSSTFPEGKKESLLLKFFGDFILGTFICLVELSIGCYSLFYITRIIVS